jgi:photosystem II stability/assembly factor-like uncharacterized protein
MRSILTLITSLILLIQANGQGRWEVLHESEGEKFLFLDFTSEYKGWKVDNSGICTTDDGGASWTRIWNKKNVVDLDFKNETTGYVVVGEPGEGKSVYQTYDAGRSWEFIGKCNYAHRIQVVSDSLQYSYNDHSILRRINREDWELVLRTGYDSYINQLTFLNADTGVCVSMRQIFRTFDGGNSWSAIDIPYQSSWRFTFLGDSMSYMLSSHSQEPILFSSDFFDSSIKIPKPERGQLELHFFSEDTIVALTENQRFYQSSDKGKTWQNISYEPIRIGGFQGMDTEMHVFGNKIFLICKWNQDVDFLFMSKDMGVHWQQMNLTFPLVDIHFVSPEKGFLQGYSKEGFHSMASY